MKYSIVLPCYNESGNLEPLVDRYRPFAGDWDFELILVDNGSTDDSAQVLSRITADPANAFARAVTIETNIGYGHGIHTGLLAAKGDILSYSHADAQTPPEDLFRAFELIESGEADISRQVIKGRRPGRDEANLCTMGLVKITNFMTGYRFEDINGQPKVFSRRLFEAMDDPPTDFSYDTYVLYMAARLGFSVTSIDVRFDPRGHGVSKSAATALKRYKTILSYLKSMAGMVWRRRGDKSNPVGQILRFIVAGMCTNIANYLTFIILLNLLNVHYVLSSVLGFFAGFVVGFIMNRSWTFGISGTKMGPELARFLLVNLVSLGANVATIWLAVDVAGITPEIGQILAIMVSAVVNFAGMKWWVFKTGGVLT